MFSKRLRDLRIENHYTQENLAEIIGVSDRTIGTWERGTREPPIKTIRLLADLFNVSTDYLLGKNNIRSAYDSKKKIDLKDDVKITYKGQPVSNEDLEIIRRFLRGSKSDK
ncbi:MAG: helix-turn-helix transcriptional regulator [Lactobacillus sp.]|uniref:helix-turn-helix domain-containing protein n=1 Tax=Bombilactobacillus bombi TaxID=1303590 RepID=UPI0035ECFF82|nr:helix-turn-helix transcriptional regulator [Lactobacillus sp.]